MVDSIIPFSIDDFKVRNGSFFRRGGFGEVWDAYHERYGRVAIKILHPLQNNSFKEELQKAMKACRDYSAVPLFGYINEFCGCTIEGIVSQFMPCGSISDLIRDCSSPHVINGGIPKHLSYRLLFEISNAMDLLHTINRDERLLHLDLKPSNVMLDQDLHAKITDFGSALWATITYLHSRPREDSNISTPAYRSPEFFLGQERTSKYDVYSFAITMWEILSGKKPFDGLDDQQIKDLVIAGRRPSLDLIPADLHGDQFPYLRSLMEDCWNQDKDRRPSFREIRERLREIKDSSSVREVSDAVTEVKVLLLRQRNLPSFDVRPDEYVINFRNALFPNQQNGNNPPAPVNMNPIPQNPSRYPIQADNDLMLTSSQHNQPPANDRYLNDEDYLQLGNNLYYSDGWEVLAYKLGLNIGQVENIKGDHPSAVQRKIEMFRVWSRISDQQRPLVSSLIRSLRSARVAVDVWEFLDPHRTIRNHM